MFQRIRRRWSTSKDEQPLVAAAWPQDYPLHTVKRFGNRYYNITRYRQIAGTRFIEVWGNRARLIRRPSKVFRWVHKHMS